MEFFAARAGRENFYTLYRAHNYHFLVYAAMFDGQSQTAWDHSQQLVREIPPVMLEEMADFLDAFIATPIHVMVRFGWWDKILEFPEPAESLFFTRSLWHYARAVAFAATGNVGAAKQEQERLEAVSQRVPATRIQFNNTCSDILMIAKEMVAGEIAYREGDYARAYAHLHAAVERDDRLNYDEPWGWMQPARHALGALFARAGQSQTGGSSLSTGPGPASQQWLGFAWAHGVFRTSRIDRSSA